MKLAITSFLLVASIIASVNASVSGLRLTNRQESDITIANKLSSDNKDVRELLSSWCDPATPVKWHPDYSKSWPISGCVQKADCDSPSYANQATCCAAHYGGQTGGACSSPVTPTVNPNIGKYCADYSTPWPIAGCKNTLPQPIYATVFYATQLQCCKGAFGGQISGACIMGLPSPPTAKPSVAPTKSPINLAGQGGDWYADYSTAWPIAGCKNTTPLPIYATMFYNTQLLCCKGAFGGQISGACIMGLPSPPTAKPTPSPTSKPTAVPTFAPTAKPSCSSQPFAESKSFANLLLQAKLPVKVQVKVLRYLLLRARLPQQRAPPALLWYPKYDVAGTCPAKLPLLPPGSRPYYDSKEECCQSTYDSWGGTKTADCITGSTV